jgi:hypothetical protein
MNRPNLTDLAKQGDVSAIAYLMQRALHQPEVQVRAALQRDRLHIVLESSSPLNQHQTVVLIQHGLVQLQIPSLYTAQIEAWQSGHGHPLWRSTLNLTTQVGEDCKQEAENCQSKPVASLSKTIYRHPSITASRRKPAQTDLGLLFLEKFNPFQLALLSILAFHSVFGSAHYTRSGFLDGSDFFMMFLHNVNLIFHEAGHTILSFLGQFVHLVGGSFMQIAIPAALCVYFFITQQRYSSAIALWWTGQNFLDVSVYIKDAQERILPLLGGEASLHDWHFILLDLRLLIYDDVIGNIAYGIGIVLYIMAIAAGFYYSQNLEASPIEPTQAE